MARWDACFPWIKEAALGALLVSPIQNGGSTIARGSQDGPESTTIEQTSTCAWIRFAPTPEQQAQYSSQGIRGDFVVQYDVQMSDLIGDIQTYNGYFVHYFSPRSLPVVAKNVIFVIDVSSSMIGTKIRQTKEAMNTILSDLRGDDYFNIITFSTAVEMWKPNQSIQATKQNVQNARKYVSNMVANGWTDINAALLAAAKFFRGDAPAKAGGGAGGGGANRVPLVIFLTDGEPTSGVTSASAIVGNAREAMGGSLSLFCLGFGDDVDFTLLQRLALDNRGAARRIYEDADANLQLTGFYAEVASPLLFDVRLEYPDNRVGEVTGAHFPAFYNGSELVVAGRLDGGPAEPLRVRLRAEGLAHALELDNEIALNATGPWAGCPESAEGPTDFVQRLWAYRTVQELLQARLRTDEEEGRKLLTERATALSLKYNFVTPVTSMVVVKPERGSGQATAATASTRSPLTPRLAASAKTPSRRPSAPPGTPPGRGISPPAARGTSTAPGSRGAPGPPAAGPSGSKTSPTPSLPTPPGAVHSAAPEAAVTLPEMSASLVRGTATTDAPTAYATMLRSGDVYVQTKVDSDHFETEMDYDHNYDDYDVEDAADMLLHGVLYDFTDGLVDPRMPGPGPYLYSVDGDPHFVVKVPNSNDSICFTIDGHAEDTLRLVEDPLSGVTVDGHLMGAPLNPEHTARPRNFFDWIAVRAAIPGRGGYRVNVSREGVTLEGEHRLSLPWQPASDTSKPGLRLAVSRSAGVGLWLGPEIQFQVLLHRYAHPSHLQLDHLGFYVVRGDGLSQRAQGLLGQFQHADIDLRSRGSGGRGRGLAELRRGGRTLEVSLATKKLKDSPLPAHAAPCWLVRQQDVAQLIGGTYADYVVPRPRRA
uniref:inter-alpha-trypsin inhibitor heavy chain H6-like n=1 Tax=Pristiophorus japonicus TaxID=55135 RepID=UPI00398F6B52